MLLGKHGLLIAVLFITGVCSCSSDVEPLNTQGHESEQTAVLPSTPYAFRSVLDDKPRILTVALSDALWVAYDTSSAQFYKAWQGDALLAGPVYDNSHGPQPISQGSLYYQNGWLNEKETAWFVGDASGAKPVPVQYGGHRFENQQIIILYRYESPSGWVVRVEETLSYASSLNNSKPFNAVFVRDFSVAGLPDNTHLMLANTPFLNTTELTGSVTQTESQLMFKNGQSRLAISFTQFLDKPEEIAVDSVVTEEKGLTLIKASDCGACHNDVFKTVGPSYQAIARRYQDTEQVIHALSEKVIAGGAGIWGRAMMTPHLSLPLADAKEIVTYILSLDDNSKKNEDTQWNFNQKSVPAFLEAKTPGLTKEKPGALVYLHYFEGDMPQAESIQTAAPALSALTSQIHFTSTDGFSVEKENFSYQIKTNLRITKNIGKTIRLVSDDGAYLYIDGEREIDNWGFHATQASDATIQFTKGDHPLEIIFFQGTGGGALSLQWYNEETGLFDVIPASAFIVTPNDVREVVKRVEPAEVTNMPGDAAPLTGIHPAFNLTQARPDSFEPMVGGIDFLPDGRMVVSTWDADGSIYIVENFSSNNPANISVKRIAKGLAEPLGIQVVDSDIYVMQKQELTKLVDTNNDDFIDEYITVANNWAVTGNFHEFGFGLVYRDEYFYATLATAILPGGASASPQAKDRGRLMKIHKDTGAIEFIAKGLRTPNGIGPGVGKGLFIADNQGDWLPSSKIVEVTEGAFYGSRSVDFEGTQDLEVTQPVVWLPQDEINNSPSEPTSLNVGPYQNQMIFGDVTLGGIKRVYAERINGRLQGAVFRFTQGLEAGVNRLDWAPDGSLIVGGVGNPGNWGQTGKLWYGLQRLVYNHQSAFEMLSVSAKADGFDITFTEAIQEGQEISAENFLVQQWWYEPTRDYGGPKKDLEVLKVVDLSFSADRKTVHLKIDGMKEEYLVYFRIIEPFTSNENHSLWTTEAWYTLNSIPKK